MPSQKYVYLANADWAQAWASGGRVPIYRASKYRAHHRQGTQTPDENTIRSGANVSGDQADFIDSVIVGTGAIYAQQVTFPGNITRRSVMLHRENWDGYLLCLSNSESRDICEQLLKKACVLIHDVDGLATHVSRAIGVRGVARRCTYTNMPARDVFTKSTKDAWQDEFRLFWDTDAEIETVPIPPNTGALLWAL